MLPRTCLVSKMTLCSTVVMKIHVSDKCYLTLLDSAFLTITITPRSHCPGFQSRRRYGVDTGAHRDHAVATPASTALNRDTPCWTGVHRDVVPVVSKIFKPPGLTGTYRAVKQRRLIPGRHCSSYGMNRISTVRPPGETVANRHELCPRWRYGDSRLGHGVSRRRSGVAPTLAGQTTVWHGSSRWMPAKLRYDNGISRCTPT